MTTELSTKWYNVIRRQMRAVPPVEHKVECPDCGSETWLREGRYGRFYACVHYSCQGTVGARLDGTPRPEKGSQEEIVSRAKARAAIQAVLKEVVEPDGFRLWFRGVLNPFKDILEASQVCPYVHVRYVKVSGWLTLPEIRTKPGLHLRKRTVPECELIEEAARKYLHEVRNTAWDRIALGGPSIEAAE